MWEGRIDKGDSANRDREIWFDFGGACGLIVAANS